jgi:hypothetical protein
MKIGDDQALIINYESAAEAFTTVAGRSDVDDDGIDLFGNIRDVKQDYRP